MGANFLALRGVAGTDGLALDPDRDNDPPFLTDMVRLARRLLFLWSTSLVLVKSLLSSLRSFDRVMAPSGPDGFRSEPSGTFDTTDEVEDALGPSDGGS